jgi:hypothetical protein
VADNEAVVEVEKAEFTKIRPDESTSGSGTGWTLLNFDLRIVRSAQGEYAALSNNSG